VSDWIQIPLLGREWRGSSPFISYFLHFVDLPTRYSKQGLLSLAGIIVNNAVLLLERIEAEIASGRSNHDAVVSAAAKRLRYEEKRPPR
jgi:hypothetical protein